MIEEDRGLQELREGMRKVRDGFANEYSEGSGQATTKSRYLGGFTPEKCGGMELDPTAVCTKLILSYGDEHVLGMPGSF